LFDKRGFPRKGFCLLTKREGRLFPPTFGTRKEGWYRKRDGPGRFLFQSAGRKMGKRMLSTLLLEKKGLWGRKGLYIKRGTSIYSRLKGEGRKKGERLIHSGRKGGGSSRVPVLDEGRRKKRLERTFLHGRVSRGDFLLSIWKKKKGEKFSK